MKISMKAITGLFLLMVMAFVVIGATNFGSDRVPAEFTTLTSTAVNFSVNFSQNNDGATVFNFSIYNSSNPASDRNYSRLSLQNISINSTPSPVTFTFADSTRFWYFVNVTNGSSSGGPVLSDVRIFDVETKFLRFRFGGFDTINFTADSGEVRTSGNVTALRLMAQNQSGNLPTCDDPNAGSIMFNGTFWGCSNNTWKRFNYG
mgnify:CR=1 FL=1